MQGKFIEQLETRRLLAVTASFSPSTGVLSIFGDSGNNTIIIKRNAAGAIKINGNGVSIQGGTPTAANTTLISAFGQGGNDDIELDERNGALPVANLFGGTGNDTLIGGSGADQLFGQAGNDDLEGAGNNDLLFGGDDDDLLIGGPGDDQSFGQAGNDTMVWNPGDGTDVNEGGDGTDTTQVNGGDGAEVFTATANGTRVRFDRVTPAPFSLDIGTTENLQVNMNGGDDTFTGSNGLASLIAISVNGGAGNDTITGGDGADLLKGGGDNDVIAGGRGNDTVQMGAGDDTFVWNPGDGSDSVEGQAGNDTMIFNGANVSEKITLSASGNHVLLNRDVANINMDTSSVETIDFNALGGADTVTVNDLSHTPLAQLNVSLGSPAGSTAGDGAADTIILNATNKVDDVSVAGSGSSYTINGLSYVANVSGSEGANDRLNVNLLNGDDSFEASALPAGVTGLTVDAGSGKDTLVGSAGDDLLIGGDNNDLITGGRGNDVALMGAGDDVFVWNPGDGSDVVEGQGDYDLLEFNGSNVGENIDVSANGSRVRFTRDVANITMDLNQVEEVDVATLGGADSVTVNDLTGTGMQYVYIDLSATPGTDVGDGQIDTVTVNGTNFADDIDVKGSDADVTVTGLAAEVDIVGSEGDFDHLNINALAGADTVDASNLEAGTTHLAINGGDDADLITGSDGDDLINGGRGNDVALMGDGNDTFVWNPGDGSDTVEGQEGTDTLQFNGANINEKIDLSANGSRLRFTRDVGNIVMDVDGVESVNFAALGGADTITVNDLTGTDVKNVNIDLGAAGGAGDGQADTVIVNATSGADIINASGSGGSASVVGLFSKVNITHAEPANDRLVINALGGDDVIDASALKADSIQLTEDGGDGNDVLIGSDGNDVLLGGANDDILIGGLGLDILDGGTGDNILIQ